MEIYRIYNVINNKSYIGLSRNVNKRLIKHFSYLRNNTHTNKHLQASFNIFGEHNFKFEILTKCFDIYDLSIKEKYYIELYKSNDSEYGYNFTDGGECKFSVSAETRLKLSLANKDRPLTQEHKDKISSSNIGRIISQESRDKISTTIKENIKNGYKPNISGLKLGHISGEFKHTEDTKITLSKFRLGKSYEDLYGIEEAKVQKLKKIEQCTGDSNPNYKYLDIELVKELIKNGLKLIEISKQINISQPTIITRFKKETNLSITQYKKTIK